MNIVPNALYRADALDVLGRIKSQSSTLIYLDPPWYSDIGSLWRPSKEDSSHGLREYLSFLLKILQQSRRILSEYGSLYFHSTPQLNSDVRLILDQVFGRRSFRAEFVWSQPRHRLAKPPALTHETIFLYSKTDSFIFNRQTRPLSDTEIGMRYRSRDERGKYQLVDLTMPIIRPALQFEWEGWTPPPKRSWRYTKEKLNNLKSESMIDFPQPSGRPRLKVYLSDHPGVEIGSIWDDIPRTTHKIDQDLRYLFQQPEPLLERIIMMGSNVGDIVVDPFCGSGTTLAVSQKLDRRWIGCDSSLEAFSISKKRLEALDLSLGIDFHIADQELLVKEFPLIPIYYFPLILPEDIALRPLIITEGKTDWKHMKAAFMKLRALGYFENFDIEFREYEDDIQMGDSELKTLCGQLSKIPQSRKIICIFDRDNDSIIKKVTEQEKDYKDWGNNVFSFAIPVPEHRKESDGICIELYYTDDEIKRADSNGRRLFLSNEFSVSSGRHKQNQNLTHPYPKHISGPYLKIIDNDVFNQKDENIALPKSQFASYVLDEVKGFDDFDVSQFRKIFDIIVEISMN